MVPVLAPDPAGLGLGCSGGGSTVVISHRMGGDQVSNSYWWCPTCQAFVSAQAVTNNEQHDLCGTYLGDCQDEPPEREA